MLYSRKTSLSKLGDKNPEPRPQSSVSVRVLLFYSANRQTESHTDASKRLTPDGPSLAAAAGAATIQYKLSVLMYRCLNGAAPRYLIELATPVGSTVRRRLRSASSTDLVEPATRRSTIGDRAFAVAGPRAWNSLPPAVRSSATYNIFKKRA